MLEKFSYQDRCWQLSKAFWNKYPEFWLEKIGVWEDFIIVWGDGKYFKIPYSVDNNAIMFADDWEEVYPEWISSEHVLMEEIKTFKNFVVKHEDENTLLIGGYGVIFDSVDLEGESFTKNTDFMLDIFPVQAMLYDHNCSGIDEVIGRTKSTNINDYGIWVEAELYKHKKYTEAIEQLMAKNVLGWSSGSVTHMVTKEGNEIKRWPLVEFSLTTTPAEPKTLGVEKLELLAKNFQDIAKSLESLELKNDKNTEKVEHSESKKQTKLKGNNKMDQEQVQNYIEKQMKSLRESMTVSFGEELKNTSDSFSEQINKVLEVLEGSKKNAGYITEDGGNKDPQVKSFGDFLLAIKRRDIKRLASVYKSTKDVGDDSGESGGYLLPEEYRAELLQLAMNSSQVLQRVQRVPVNSGSGRYPALDQFAAPTAGVGDTAFAGGLVANEAGSGSSGGTLTETQPTFETLNWRLHKVGGFVQVDNELVDDSPFAIEQLLRSLFSVAIAGKKEYYVLRGTGSGEPLGILNSDAAIGVAADSSGSFTWSDSTEIFSRFKSAGGTPVWLVHPSMWESILTMELGSAGSLAYVNSMQTANPNSLMGYEILTSEHLPQSNASGNIVLADLNAYLMFEKQGLQIAMSEHQAFTSDQITWRFLERCTGMSWLRSAITLAGPGSAYTVSPFVYNAN